MRRVALACAIVGSLGWSACTSAPDTTPTTPTGPTTETYQGLIAPNGFVAHDFVAPNDGTITVTFTTMTPSVPMGFGVGVPPASIGAGCNLTRSVVATAGASAQFALSANAGLYCVELYDAGNLLGAVGAKGQAGFTITIAHP
jgi:hypothetical protein